MGIISGVITGVIVAVTGLVAAVTALIDAFKRKPDAHKQFNPFGHQDLTDQELASKKSDLINQARSRINLDAYKYNIAFCGPTNVGKSYLINTILGVNPGDRNAADVGRVETTTSIKKYPWLQHTDLWDLPGAGTINHPMQSYFQDKCLFAFDVVAILLHDRFESELKIIADQAREWGCEVVFVFTKADILSSDYIQENQSVTEEIAAQAVKIEIASEFHRNQLSDENFFVISARYYKKQLILFDEIDFINYMTTAAIKRHRR